MPDSEFDPHNRYRRLERSRRRLSADQNVLSDSVMSGEFNNPYVQMSNNRLRDILNHDMRGPGHVADPEGLTDPALLYEWNMGYSRIHSKDNTYTQWLDEQSRLAEMTEQSRYRGSHRTGRPGAYIQREKPYGSERKYPRGSYTEHQRQRRDMQEQLQRATEQGIADGREILRLQEKAKREAYQRQMQRMEEDRRRALDQQRRAYDRQMQVYRQQQEQMVRHADAQSEARRASPAPRQQTRQSVRGAQQQTQTAPRKPQYGPLGFYTPKPQTSDDRRSGRQPQHRK